MYKVTCCVCVPVCSVTAEEAEMPDVDWEDSSPGQVVSFFAIVFIPFFVYRNCQTCCCTAVNTFTTDVCCCKLRVMCVSLVCLVLDFLIILVVFYCTQSTCCTKLLNIDCAVSWSQHSLHFLNLVLLLLLLLV